MGGAYYASNRCLTTQHVPLMQADVVAGLSADRLPPLTTAAFSFRLTRRNYGAHAEQWAGVETDFCGSFAGAHRAFPGEQVQGLSENLFRCAGTARWSHSQQLCGGVIGAHWRAE